MFSVLTNIRSVAGSETTATELCGLTNYLLRNPVIFQKLKDELRSACKTEADLNMDVLGSLPYMNACIEEGLRIFPPVPIGLLRTVPKGGAVIDGNQVSGGVRPHISLPLYYVFNDVLDVCMRSLLGCRTLPIQLHKPRCLHS